MPGRPIENFTVTKTNVEKIILDFFSDFKNMPLKKFHEISFSITFLTSVKIPITYELRNTLKIIVLFLMFFCCMYFDYVICGF